MRLCILKSRASFVLLGLCNNCKYTVCACPKNGSVAKRCGRDNSIYHPLGIFLRLFSLSFYTLGLTFFSQKK